MREEKLIKDWVSETSEEERVKEVYEQKPVEKFVSERIIEKRKPFVYEREIQKLDPETGEVIDKQVEVIDDPDLVKEHVSSGVTKAELEEALRGVRQSTTVVAPPTTPSVISTPSEQVVDNLKGIGMWCIIGVEAILLVWIAVFR